MISLPKSPPDPSNNFFRKEHVDSVIRTVKQDEFFFLLKDSNSLNRCEIDILLMVG